MSLTKSTKQVTTQASKIPSHHLAQIPEVPDLTDYLHQVMEHQVELLELKWPSEKADGFYSLVLRAPNLSGEAKWSFYLASDLLWEYSTCDVLLIHNLIGMASDKQAHGISGEALLATSQSYRAVTKQQDAYFIRTEVTSEADMPEKTDSPKPVAATTPKPIDSKAIESVMLQLRDAQTGLYTYPAFLYFLEQAYFQSCRTHAPISLVLIEFTPGNGMTAQLGTEQTFEVVAALTSNKRRTDLIAQYESDKLIILSPSTDHIGSKIFGRRIAQTLGTVSNTLFDKTITFGVGLASFPKDGESMGMFLAAAEAATTHALNSGLQLVAHSDLTA